MGGACCTNGEMRNDDKILVGNLKGRVHSEYRGVDVNTVLECILGK